MPDPCDHSVIDGFDGSYCCYCDESPGEIVMDLKSTIAALKAENARLLAANEHLLKLTEGWTKRATRAEAALSGQGEAR